MEQFGQESIQQRVHIAVERLELHDAYLLRIDGNERSITHRLAMYLQDEFEGWDVDCEYNRDHHSPDHVKRLQSYTDPIEQMILTRRPFCQISSFIIAEKPTICL